MIPLITRDELKAAIEGGRRGLLTFGTVCCRHDR